MKSNKEYTSSFKVQDMIVPSRIFLAPINTGFGKDGNPTSNLILFHTARSGKGIGISYVGNVAIDSAFVTNENTLFFTKNLDQWKKLTEKIYFNGSLPGVQIACRNTKLQPPRRWINQDISFYIQVIRHEIALYSEKFLEGIAQKFIHNAQLAYEVGFKVVQIHAAHGYFISNFLNPGLNSRKDIYGTKKTSLLEMIVKGIRSILPNIILDVRVSLLDGLKSRKFELAEKQPIIDGIAELDVDIISISNGIYDIDKQLIYPPAEWGHGVFIDIVIPFALRHPSKLWNVAGNIWNLSLLPSNLPTNISFSVGRSLIADPDFVVKSADGLHQSIKICTRANLCHYYSRGLPNIACPVDNYLSQFI
jgi:2,4-dienoyl-CoA reductase-like NADH-dependent reductase (Old Yellow Enzyme family)